MIFLGSPAPANPLTFAKGRSAIGATTLAPNKVSGWISFIGRKCTGASFSLILVAVLFFD
jgi:hypothetical protein